jgi:hypothetical protein
MVRARFVLAVAAPGALASLAACSGTPFRALSDTEEHSDGATFAVDAGAAQPSLDAFSPTDDAREAGASAPVDAHAPGDEAPGEADAEAGGADAAPLHATCAVTFTVTGAFVDGVLLRGVAVGGDAPALGAWNPSSAVALTAIAPGVWTGDVVLEDALRVQFRFLETGPTEIVWESWGTGSNRSLTVACAPADGRPGGQYVGQFDVKPPDAT